MAISQQPIAVLLCASLVISTMGLESCKKSGKGEQAPPAATFAVPTADELYQMVAPIALFPDKLLAQVLAASTFPDQVTAAWDYLQQNPSVKGPDLMQAVNGQDWDNSVKGLTQFPDVLQQMAGNLSWTSSLGDAYFNSPQNVMNAVQVMRQRAQQAGNLKSTPQQNVEVQNQAPSSAPVESSAEVQDVSSDGGQTTVVQAPPQTIVIENSSPEVVYVPQYNPTAVYGAPVATYPGYSTGDMVATGVISFGVGMMIGAAMNNNNNCCGWGYNSWNTGWNNASINYNNNVYVSNSNTFTNRSNYNNANYNRNNVNGGNRNQVNPNNRAGGAGGVGRAGGVGGVGGAGGVGRAGGVGGVGGVGDRNSVGNNRGGDFGNNKGPSFDQGRNQSQFRDDGRGNQGRGDQGRVDQGRGGNNGGARPSQQPAGGRNQAAQPRANTNNRQPARGYGDGGNRGGNNAMGNQTKGGNARADSSRGQQSVNGGSRSGSNTASRGGGGGGAKSGGGGGRSGGGGGGGAKSKGGGGRR